MYNTETGASVVGRYDLMDYGCYNGNCWYPVGYSSYERYVCGWVIPAEVTDPYSLVGVDPDKTVTREPFLHIVHPLIRYPDVYLYRETPNANDYYLIEYRLKESWDKYIPQEGLLAWHIDYDEQAWNENTVNNDPDHLRVDCLNPSEIPTGIIGLPLIDSSGPCVVYDVRGHHLTALPTTPGIYILRFPDGSTKKVFR